MYVKLACGNVRKSVRDYAVYFGTLCLATCLLYAFTASTDYLLALDLTADQRAVYAKSGDVIMAFSVFTAIVFTFLVTYASRFIARRRKREFATYALMGMRRSRVAVVLALEGGLVSACSLVAGIAAGTALSPAFGLVAAFVFDVPWKPLATFSPDAALWTAGCFVAISLFATALTVRDVCRQPLVELMQAERAPERLRLGSRRATAAQLALGLALLFGVWGTCLFQPAYFLVLCLPMGLMAFAGTYLVLRFLAARVPQRMRTREAFYYAGLRPFAVRQVEAKVEGTCAALACTCVLVAAAVCMVCAGLLFSVGMRGGEAADAFNPIGYVGIFYGATFLVAAAAVLGLQQLSEASDNRRAYRTLSELGASPWLLRSALRAQVGVYFAVPGAGALAHSVFGLALMAFLAEGTGARQLVPLAAGTLLFTVAVLGTYYLLTCRQCARTVLPKQTGRAE